MQDRKTGQISYKLGAVFYVVWGLLHVAAANKIYQLGALQDAGIVQGRLYQAAWNMLYLALFAIVIAALYNWKNSRMGYWLNAFTISAVDIGFILLMLIPGYSDDYLGPICWILGLLCTTVGVRTAPTTA